MLITHGTLVTMGTPNESIPDGALYLEGDRIAIRKLPAWMQRAAW